jgi:hypothetical protein
MALSHDSVTGYPLYTRNGFVDAKGGTTSLGRGAFPSIITTASHSLRMRRIVGSIGAKELNGNGVTGSKRRVDGQLKEGSEETYHNFTPGRCYGDHINEKRVLHHCLARVLETITVIVWKILRHHYCPMR